MANLPILDWGQTMKGMVEKRDPVNVVFEALVPRAHRYQDIVTMVRGRRLEIMAGELETWVIAEEDAGNVVIRGS